MYMRTPLTDDNEMVIDLQEFGEDISMKSKAFVNTISAVGVGLSYHFILFCFVLGHVFVCSCPRNSSTFKSPYFGKHSFFASTS